MHLLIFRKQIAKEGEMVDDEMMVEGKGGVGCSRFLTISEAADDVPCLSSL